MHKLKCVLYYWARKHSKQIKKSNDYRKLQRTVIVLIANFNIDKLANMEFHTKWKIIDEKHRKTYNCIANIIIGCIID